MNNISNDHTSGCLRILYNSHSAWLALHIPLKWIPPFGQGMNRFNNKPGLSQSHCTDFYTAWTHQIHHGNPPWIPMVGGLQRIDGYDSSLLLVLGAWDSPFLNPNMEWLGGLNLAAEKCWNSPDSTYHQKCNVGGLLISCKQQLLVGYLASLMEETNDHSQMRNILFQPCPNHFFSGAPC